MESGTEVIAESGALTLSEAAWAVARRRAAIVQPLADSSVVAQADVEIAAQELGLSARQIYRLVKVWRGSGGNIASLVAAPPSGGKGKSRLSGQVATIVVSSIEDNYLTRQKPSIQAVVKEVRRLCRLAGLTPPAYNTVANRIRQIAPQIATRKREGGEAARRFQSAGGDVPRATAPLEQVQIDHTKIDLMVVEPTTRQSIGRPYLTVAIDTYSRAIMGICVTLEAPSATSVGLCLAHAASDKVAWLERLGVKSSWPMHGKPRSIHVDNAAEFHSESLRRGCDVHGVTIQYRPPGLPHFGGIVERVIGTTMRMIHELPGTTFSNVESRGSYDAEKNATLTLAELESWLALAIGGRYHEEIHSALLQSPKACWEAAMGAGQPFTIGDQKAFLIDFLPVVRRSIGRQGFTIDHVGYFSSALSKWIAERDRRDKFIIRRDPRDLSRIWVLDPDQAVYIEVPYRTLSNPAITLWEHRKAVETLRQRGREQFDELAIFSAVNQMRAIADQAVSKTKTARRDVARREHLKPALAGTSSLTPPTSGDLPSMIKPFADIEEW